jgi:hypothetical protein
VKHRITNGLPMSIVDSISEPVVRKTLNTDPGFERLRYLVVLTAATEPPFGITGLPSEGNATFNINQLSRIARQLGLEFEKYRGAERVFGQLEKSGLIKATRNEQTGFHTYCPTESGKSQTILNLDRLRKVQELQSQAKTMQMTIRKQLTKPPPTVLEITLGPNEFMIGTDEENDLMVRDRYMSRRHARVTYEAGTWVLEDLNSRNGCWKIEPNNLGRVGRAVIADNDMYQLGSTIVRFKVPQ